MAPIQSSSLELWMGSIMALFPAQTDEYGRRYEDFPIIPLYFRGRRGGWARDKDGSTALLLGHKHCAHRALACGRGSAPISLLLGKMRCAQDGLSYMRRVGGRTEGAKGTRRTGEKSLKGDTKGPFLSVIPQGGGVGVAPGSGSAGGECV